MDADIGVYKNNQFFLDFPCLLEEAVIQIQITFFYVV